MSYLQKAVIPAAGQGTRMAPISDYLPKPMLPLGKKPVLQHILEEIEEAGISEVAVVIHPEHTIIPYYFKNNANHELNDKLDIHFITDDSGSGPGGAILKAKEFIGDGNFLTVFSDAPVLGSGRGAHLQQLTEKYKEECAAAAISLYKISPSEAFRRGIVSFEEKKMQEEGVQIQDMIEKPSPENNQSQWASACRYAGGAEVMSALEEAAPDAEGELQLTEALRKLVNVGRPVYGLPLEAGLSRHDTGNFEGYFDAFDAFAGR